MCSSKYSNILEKVFTKPVENLRKTNRKPPNKQVLRLYHDILKFTRDFDWEDDNGIIWRDSLRKSARKEFEEAREEKDPIILYKMMITAKDAMKKTQEMVPL